MAIAPEQERLFDGYRVAGDALKLTGSVALPPELLAAAEIGLDLTLVVDARVVARKFKRVGPDGTELVEHEVTAELTSARSFADFTVTRGE